MARDAGDWRRVAGGGYVALKHFSEITFDVFRKSGIAEPTEEPEEEFRRLYVR